MERLHSTHVHQLLISSVMIQVILSRTARVNGKGVAHGNPELTNLAREPSNDAEQYY